MQTTAPTHRAIGEYHSPVHPSATKIVHVRISVAIVMPEIGFDELPISPVMRDDTLTKKKPKGIVRMAASGLPNVGRRGTATRKMASASEPPRTIVSGRS